MRFRGALEANRLLSNRPYSRSPIARLFWRGYAGSLRRISDAVTDRSAPKVLKLVGEGQSYREISHRIGLRKNTVLDIVKRERAA
jgi:putative DNA-invertase from lambdoid prophage Rac